MSILLQPNDLAGGRAVIQRLIDDIADQAEDDEEPVRPIPCWLALERVGVVVICVGTARITDLPEQAAGQVMPAIREWDPTRR